MKRVFSFFLFSFLMSLVALAQDPQGVKNIDLPDRPARYVPADRRGYQPVATLYCRL